MHVTKKRGWCIIKFKMHLNGLEKITEFIKIVLASGYLKNEKPLSLILIAPISSGKTTAINQFQKNPNVTISTDTTAWGILNKYQNKLKSGELRHIIIPDLLSVLARRETSVQTFLLFVNASCEDGIFPSKTYAIEVNEFIQPFGWILCLTEDAYKKKSANLKGMGFESRFLKVSYKYSLETIQRILKGIIEEEKFVIPEIKITNYKTKKLIKGNSKIFQELLVFSKLLCNNGDSEILRMQRKLQTFLKASAFLRKDNHVTTKDLDKLKDLIDMIN